MSRAKPWRLARLACVCALLMVPAVSVAYYGGPPNGHAGDPPGNKNCTECHGSYAVNSGPGVLELQGLPEAYAPGQSYPLRVSLTQPDRSLWGFELTVIREDDLLQAGDLAAVNPTHVQISAGPGDERDYAKHRGPGTQEGEPSGEWDLLWTAPAVGAGPIRVYVAGNAANNNGSSTLDYIYTLDVGAMELNAAGVAGAVRAASVPSLLIWPQPARDHVTVECGPNAAAPSTWRLIDSTGRLREIWEVGDAGSVNSRCLELVPGIYWLVPFDRSLTAQRIVVVR